MAGDVAEGPVEATPETDARAASDAASCNTPSNAAAAPVVGDSKLRRSIAFTWKDVMVSSPVGESTARDAIFELASVLEAVALWKMARAATLCADARFGIGGEAVSKVRQDIYMLTCKNTIGTVKYDAYQQPSCLLIVSDWHVC